jgi:hypothetical protein
VLGNAVVEQRRLMPFLPMDPANGSIRLGLRNSDDQHECGVVSRAGGSESEWRAGDVYIVARLSTTSRAPSNAYSVVYRRPSNREYCSSRRSIFLPDSSSPGESREHD